MSYETIADVYAANAQIRERLTATVAGISPAELTAALEGEDWNIQNIVEHIAMVDTGAARICAKLVAGAKDAGKTSDGSVTVSPEFGEKLEQIAGMRVEAPERVQPTGNVTVTEALEQMAATRRIFNSIRADLEFYDLSQHTYPHPFLGDLTASEWLILAGGHEHRHTKQIESHIQKIRQ